MQVPIVCILAASFRHYTKPSIALTPRRWVSAISDETVEGPIRYQAADPWQAGNAGCLLGVHAHEVIRPLSLGLGASLAIGGICWALEMGMSGPQVVQFKC